MSVSWEEGGCTKLRLKRARGSRECKTPKGRAGVVGKSSLEFYMAPPISSSFYASPLRATCIGAQRLQGAILGFSGLLGTTSIEAVRPALQRVMVYVWDRTPLKLPS